MTCVCVCVCLCLCVLDTHILSSTYIKPCDMCVCVCLCLFVCVGHSHFEFNMYHFPPFVVIVCVCKKKNGNLHLRFPH